MSLSKAFVPSVAQVSLPRVPTDEVMPVHYFDDTPIFRNSIGCMLIRFDDVLDPDQLRKALAQVPTLPGGWNKLGGRVRLNASTALGTDVISVTDWHKGEWQIGNTRSKRIHTRKASRLI